MTKPSFNKFNKEFRKNSPQIVWNQYKTKRNFDPVPVLMNLASKESYSFLLESVEGGKIKGRYTFYGSKAKIAWNCKKNKSKIKINYSNGTSKEIVKNKGPLIALQEFISQTKVLVNKKLPPMVASFVGYLGYDMVREIEKLPTNNPNLVNVPDGILFIPEILVVFDSYAKIISVAIFIISNKKNSQIEYAKAANTIKATITKINNFKGKYNNYKNTLVKKKLIIQSNTKKIDFINKVERIKKYIKAGDAFQTVISQRFNTSFSAHPIDLYKVLRTTNPSPFMYFINFKNFHIVGSSPEILVRVRDKKITIRPIAGTRPRGKNKKQDDRYKKSLLKDPKEIAEHLMLLDLGRNDVGKVAMIDSVKVTDKFKIEKYSHVMHIVSNVEGKLNKDFDIIDALKAGFPAGTLTGAPKVRAMEIIDELEKERRSVYAGGLGYFSLNGNMDTCIVLRTAVIINKLLHVQAGAGIVADSVPEKEFEETVNKAKAIINAAEIAANYMKGK